MPEATFPIFLTVDPNNPGRGLDLNAKGNRAFYTFSNPLKFPKGSHSATLSLAEFNAFYTFQNIGASTIQFEFSSDDGATWGSLFTHNGGILQLDAGLYSFEDLVSTVSVLLGDNDITTEINTLLTSTLASSDILKFVPLWATSKIRLETGMAIELAPAERIRITFSADLDTILGGFGSVVIEDTFDFINSSDRAKFATISSLVLRSSLVGSGGSFGGEVGSRVIRVVPINVGAGKQINYEPIKDIMLPVNLDGEIQDMQFDVLDQDQNDVVMVDKWGASLVINYQYDD